MRLAAGGDGFRLGAELIDDAFENAVDHADGAEVETALHAGNGVGADDVLGRAELDQRQAGGLGEERLDGDADADGDGAAEVFGVLRDHVEVDGGAEIDDHAGAAVFIEAGDSVDEAIRADFAGIVVTNGEADIGARGDEHRFLVEVAPGHEGEGGIDGRDDAGDDDAVD